jgi:glycylpeptide N-tetradecanoyltransferase
MKKTKVDISLLQNVVMKPKFKPTQIGPDEKQGPFWETQPVPKPGQVEDSNTSLISDEDIKAVRPTPIDLLDGFEWRTFDISQDSDLRMVHNFIDKYYIDSNPDEDGYSYKLDYTPEFMRWTMCPPNYSPTLHLGIWSHAADELIGFIAGMPCNLRVYGKQLRVVEINFLCVHPEFRKMKMALAPMLIQEVTRRVNLLGIWQAIYTGTLMLPHRIATSQYFHRGINVKKLIDIKFMHQHPKLTMKGMLKLYQLPQETKTPGLRPLVKRDVSGTCQLLNKFMSAYHIAMEFTNKEFEHMFLPKENIVYSFVVEDPQTKMITDFISFYCLPSKVTGHQRHTGFKAAYSYYNVAAKTNWNQLMLDAIVLAQKLNFDVFNALDLMENKTFLEQLKFVPGSGRLKYHLFNWNCLPTQPEGLGVVLR